MVSTPDAPAVVKVVLVQSQNLRRMDRFPGEIKAYQDVAIYPKVPGFIKWIGIDRGSIVRKGQSMITLVAPELAAQRNDAAQKAESAQGQLHEGESKLASARAKLLETKAKLLSDNDTYQRTYEASLTPGVVSANEVIVLRETVNSDKQLVKAWEENVLAAEKQVGSLAASLKAARSNAASFKDIQDYLTITAPFDGYITERNMHVGSFVGPLGNAAYPPIVRIQQLNLLRIVTPVPEISVGGVEPGAEVQFTVSTHPGQLFTGKVARLGNYLEQRTRTMPVELNYWNTDRKILPGMFCQVLWPTRGTNTSLFVPESSVVTDSTIETFVCRVNAKKEIEWVKVRKGQTMGQLTEVFGDLKAGDVVALRGSDSLRQGTIVKPEDAELGEVGRPPVQREVYNNSPVPISMPQRSLSGE